MIDTPKPSLASARVILLPSSRFFVRVVPLAPEGNPDRQIELALESRASFPVGQLYYGYRLSPRRDAALVFAAYRKRFAATETTEWSEAATVLPAFIAVLGQIPTTPAIRLWSDDQEITAVAWNGEAPLPVAIMAREIKDSADASERANLIAEIRDRAELPGASVQEYAGPITVIRQSPKGELEFMVGSAGNKLSASLSQAETETADVRDKEFLTNRNAVRKRDTILWRGFQTCLAGLAVMLLWEGAFLAAESRLDSRVGQVQRQAAGVQKIETAQSLSRRIEEMTQRRLLPFEMLALINQNRPASIQFIRSVTNGLYAMEIEAQTANAADVGQYEVALRAIPELASVETRDLRSREGVTAFVLAIAYKPEFLRQEGTP